MCLQLRRQSKACDAGLHEGDILLGINGFECRTMSHSAAMALLENAVDCISLSVFRLVIHGVTSRTIFHHHRRRRHRISAFNEINMLRRQALQRFVDVSMTNQFVDSQFADKTFR